MTLGTVYTIRQNFVILYKFFMISLTQQQKIRQFDKNKSFSLLIFKKLTVNDRFQKYKPE